MLQHQSAHNLQLQHQKQVQQSPWPLAFLASSTVTTSKSMLFARRPGRPSAASLDEDDDDDLDFEDEDADDEEGKKLLIHVTHYLICRSSFRTSCTLFH
jgi:hypothetical protein